MRVDLCVNMCVDVCADMHLDTCVAHVYAWWSTTPLSASISRSILSSLPVAMTVRGAVKPIVANAMLFLVYTCSDMCLDL